MAVARFLNVDLDLRDHLGVAALQPSLHVMHEEQDFATLEVSVGPTPPLDEVLNAIVDAVEALPPHARKLWDRCLRRTLNIGFEAGDEQRAGTSVIPASTLCRLVTVGAEVEVTNYAHRPSDIRGP